jgi:hypothetical protein
MKRSGYSRMPKIFLIFWGRLWIRRTQEWKKGIQRNLPPIEHTPNPKNIKKGLEKLGKTKHQQAKIQWLAEGSSTTTRVKAVAS